MVDNSVAAANMARILAIVHIIVGSLLICFGIADRAVEYFWTGYGCYGIWIGVWMCIAGGLGIPGSRKERSTSRNAFAGVFMGFSITSAVFGGIIIISYSIAIAGHHDEYKTYSRPAYYHDYDGYGPTEDYYYNEYRRRVDHFDAEMALSGIILILGIVEFGIGIWASVCLCMMKPCTCCYGNPPQQAGSGGMVPVQAVTPGPQGGQPQMVVVPVSGMVGNQAQFATSGAMATARQPQVTTTDGKGGYRRMVNEEFPVNT